MNSRQKKFLIKLKNTNHIYTDCDGMVFNNIPLMIQAKRDTFKTFFGFDPCELERGKVLDNLKLFYKQNLHMYKRKNFWVTRSLQVIEDNIKNEGRTSKISGKDIFHMSSKALGAAFLTGTNFPISDIQQKFDDIFKKVSEQTLNSISQYEKAKKHLAEELEIINQNYETSSITNQTYISKGITSQLVFDLYFALYHVFYVDRIQPFVEAREIILLLNQYAKTNNKQFGMISNREKNSLLNLLQRKDFIQETLLPLQKIIAGDPIKGGKPEIHQFEERMKKDEKFIYFGDLLVDVMAVQKLNTTHGKDTAFGVVVPSEYEYVPEEIETYDIFKDPEEFVYLSHGEILEVLRHI